ncbi:hypothetical protein WJX75_003798 [Coccomyxa subellipsoidea]|uniref:Uncharacterized protein n=1 Tax=Coccomyxa subellipsoidea TaxID=248742 RepID=A0ABR2YE86_9CHLO
MAQRDVVLWLALLCFTSFSAPCSAQTSGLPSARVLLEMPAGQLFEDAMAEGTNVTAVSSALSLASGSTSAAPGPAAAFPPASQEILDVFNRNNTTALSKTLSTSLAGAYSKAEASITTAINDSVAGVMQNKSGISAIDLAGAAAATVQAASRAIANAFVKAAQDQMNVTLATRAEDFQNPLSLAFAAAQAPMITAGGNNITTINSSPNGPVDLTKEVGSSVTKVLAQLSGEWATKGGPTDGT